MSIQKVLEVNVGYVDSAMNTQPEATTRCHINFSNLFRRVHVPSYRSNINSTLEAQRHQQHPRHFLDLASGLPKLKTKTAQPQTSTIYPRTKTSRPNRNPFASPSIRQTHQTTIQIQCQPPTPSPSPSPSASSSTPSSSTSPPKSAFQSTHSPCTTPSTKSEKPDFTAPGPSRRSDQQCAAPSHCSTPAACYDPRAGRL